MWERFLTSHAHGQLVRRFCIDLELKCIIFRERLRTHKAVGKLSFGPDKVKMCNNIFILGSTLKLFLQPLLLEVMFVNDNIS